MVEERDEKIDQAVNDFEKENKKFELAMKISEGDKDIAQKLISGEIKDIGVVKGAFKDETVNLNGIFIFFINFKTKVLERNYAVVSFDESIKNITPYIKWSELEKKIVDFEWSRNNLNNQSTDLKNEFQSQITFDHMDKLIELISDNNETEIKDLLYGIVSKSLNLEVLELTISIEVVNKLMIELEGTVKDKKEEEASDEVEVEVEEEDLPNEIILEGSLEISPVKGINIKDIQPGMTILIRLPDKSSKDLYYINLLNVSDGKKVFPVPGVVRSVDYDEISGYLIISQLKPGIVIKCVEQAQINIMTPEIAEKDKKVKNIRSLLIMLASLMIFLTAVYLYLFFKGII